MTRFAEPLPHGSMTTVADDVYCVRGAFRMGPGVTIGRTMTVLQAGVGLVVLNAIRLSDAAHAELDARGPVADLVKLSDSHGVDEPFYVDRYGPTVWSLPGAALGDLRGERTLGPDGPVDGGVVVDFGKMGGWREGAYWVPAGGGTLVTCDAIQNCADADGASFLGRVLGSVLGFKGGVIVPPFWSRAQKLSGSAIDETLAGLAELSFENLVTGHGPAVVGGADAMVRAAIERASSR